MKDPKKIVLLSRNRETGGNTEKHTPDFIAGNVKRVKPPHTPAAAVVVGNVPVGATTVRIHSRDATPGSSECNRAGTTHISPSNNKTLLRQLRTLGLPARSELSVKKQKTFQIVQRRVLAEGSYPDIVLFTALLHGLERVLTEIPPQRDELQAQWLAANEAMTDYIIAFTSQFNSRRPDGSTDEVAHDAAHVLSTVTLHASTVAVQLCEHNQPALVAWLEEGTRLLRASQQGAPAIAMASPSANARQAA